MTDSVSKLSQIIESAKRGDSISMSQIREIIRVSADAATNGDAVAIAEFLLDMMKQSFRSFADSN